MIKTQSIRDEDNAFVIFFQYPLMGMFLNVFEHLLKVIATTTYYQKLQHPQCDRVLF